MPANRCTPETRQVQLVQHVNVSRRRQTGCDRLPSRDARGVASQSKRADPLGDMKRRRGAVQFFDGQSAGPEVLLLGHSGLTGCR